MPSPVGGVERSVSDRKDTFFATVWRLNGLLVLALAGAGIIAVVAVAMNLAIFSSRERPHEQLTNIAGADIAAQDLRLGGFRAIAGTQLLYAPLASPSRYVGSGSSGGLGAARNLLFFDTTTKKAHWLLAGNDQTIHSYYFLLDPPSTRYGFDEGEAEKREQKAIGILVELRDAGEGTTDEAPSRAIAIASPQGRDLTRIVDATEGMLGYHQPAANSVLVFYVSGGTARVLDLDPIAREVRFDGLLSTEQ